MTEPDLRLPPALAQALPPSFRRALESSVRRRILRTLQAASAPRSLKEVAVATPGSGLSSVSYHLAILEQCGCVRASADPTARCCAQLFESSVGSDAGIAAALVAMRDVDRGPGGD